MCMLHAVSAAAHVLVRRAMSSGKTDVHLMTALMCSSCARTYVVASGLACKGCTCQLPHLLKPSLHDHIYHEVYIHPVSQPSHLRQIVGAPRGSPQCRAGLYVHPPGVTCLSLSLSTSPVQLYFIDPGHSVLALKCLLHISCCPHRPL